MANPLVSGGTTPNSATQPGLGVNTLPVATLRQKTNFPISFGTLDTPLFGNITPKFSFECVPNDDIRCRRRSNLDTYSLKSPVKSKIMRHHAYMAVPKQSIMFNTYSKIFVNPKKGDDIDFEDVRALINPKLYGNAILAGLRASDINSSSTTMDMGYYLSLFALLCDCWSSCNISSRLGRPWTIVPDSFLVSGSSDVDYSVEVPDIAGDLLSSAIENLPDDPVTIGGNIMSAAGTSFKFVLGKTSSANGVQSFRSFIDFMLKNAGDVFFSVTNTVLYPIVQACRNAVIAVFSASGTAPQYYSYDLLSRPINIEPVVAYQLACSQFMTNDDIDDVFSSELYRQNMESIENLSQDDSPVIDYFVWNGIRIYYDWCSSMWLSRMIQLLSSFKFHSIIFFCNLFALRESLRFGDMFNTARTQPLAVGDVGAPVVSESVSAVDTTISILRQRYLNLVNSAPNTIRGYSLAVFGVAPDEYPSEPRFISHVQYQLNDDITVNSAGTVGGTETTTANQGTQTSILRGNNSSFEFQSHFNDFSIIIGVEWYSVQTHYIGVRSPFAFHVDRFDDFIPQMQNIGDVEVDGQILSGSATSFGYQSNNYEYKQELSRAFGGFAVGALPSWAFTRGFTNISSVLSPYFIRHHPGEFDRFYASLTGYGDSYFHFICSDWYDINASRPMEYISNILMSA